MSRHPMWRPRASRLCGLARALRLGEQAIARVSVAVAFGLFSMMALRVALAWWSGRL